MAIAIRDRSASRRDDPHKSFFCSILSFIIRSLHRQGRCWPCTRAYTSSPDCRRSCESVYNSRKGSNPLVRSKALYDTHRAYVKIRVDALDFPSRLGVNKASRHVQLIFLIPTYFARLFATYLITHTLLF